MFITVMTSSILRELQTRSLLNWASPQFVLIVRKKEYTFPLNVNHFVEKPNPSTNLHFTLTPPDGCTRDIQREDSEKSLRYRFAKVKKSSRYQPTEVEGSSRSYLAFTQGVHIEGTVNADMQLEMIHMSNMPKACSECQPYE
ncbi:hypothetical protein PVK06_047098 [Gossypium arboreum]|uniref:Uncharacterized protein n=1 Tax=Gossypium arboreum TaxID=29729 RepID=A0ABR0MCI8_GOSAR|nr:hypothetical protein PVK06_047098 [Gossypium arboreum]